MGLLGFRELLDRFSRLEEIAEHNKEEAEPHGFRAERPNGELLLEDLPR